MEKFNKLLAAGEPTILSIFRIVTGLSFFQYGVAKFFKIPAGTMFDKLEMFALYWNAGIFEFVFGALLILGLFTRVAAFILCGEMAFAYFLDHLPRGFIPLLNGGNLAIMFCFTCLYLACAGGGPWSLDALMGKKKG
jgi:putative oxidoreductase